jgi:hypothetical protein
MNWEFTVMATIHGFPIEIAFSLGQTGLPPCFALE